MMRRVWARLLGRTGPLTGAPFLIKPNGGWCWFHAPRAILMNGRVLFGSIAGQTRDGATAGQAQLSAFDPQTHRTETVTVWDRPRPDDHNAPAIMALGDGRALVAYQGHHESGAEGRLIRWRFVTGVTPLAVGGEHTADAGAPVTYSNLAPLDPAGARIGLFHRGGGFNPNLLASDDGGASFRHAGKILHWPRPDELDPKFSGHDGGRPYVLYAVDGRGGVHMLASEDHPRAYDNSVYHGVYRDGGIRLARGAGAAVRPGEPAPRPDALDLVLAGNADAIAWPVDLKLDPATGHPVALISVRRGDRDVRRVPGRGGGDLSYVLARFDGTVWRTQALGAAGERLYRHEEDYSGLGALDPANPAIAVLSGNAEARAPRRYALRFCVTAADGASRTRPLFGEAGADQIRPVIVPLDARYSLVIWMRGAYRSYQDFDTDIWGAIYDRTSLA